MSLNDLGILVILGVLCVLGGWMWSIPVYRHFRLNRLRKIRAKKALDNAQ